MISSRTALSCGLLSLLVISSGCAAIWHELQPHRMNRLNRGPAPSLDPEFSQTTPDKQSRLAKRDAISAQTMIRANQPEFANVRAQSSDE